ncbi:MAG: hypothetical protein KTR32_11900 [Granulosicoccus sp.]|nr:hypothetical protein [Granulosicoccus sp.]
MFIRKQSHRLSLIGNACHCRNVFKPNPEGICRSLHSVPMRLPKALAGALRSLCLATLAIVTFPCAADTVILDDMQPAYIKPGDILARPVVWHRSAGVRVELKLESAPALAQLSFDTFGGLWLHWTTPKDLPSETRLLIMARDVDTGTVLDQSQLIVRSTLAESADESDSSSKVQTRAAEKVSAANQESELNQESESQNLPEPAETLDSPEPSESADLPETKNPSAGEKQLAAISDAPSPQNEEKTEPQTEQLAMVQINAAVDPNPSTAAVTRVGELELGVGADPLAGSDQIVLSRINNQIVSVGRSVAFRVDAKTQAAIDPLVEIDWLPANASFDKANDGSYRFFWQTSARDQGEHRFRIMARHPANLQQTALQEVVVVVGDPSMGQTQAPRSGK